MNRTPVTKPASPDTGGARLGRGEYDSWVQSLQPAKVLILAETALIGHRPLTNFDGSTSQEEKKRRGRGGGVLIYFLRQVFFLVKSEAM